jgi:transposase InsO family protein
MTRDIFYTLQETKVLVEQWRQIYNKARPHFALGYRPPAPEAIGILPAMSTQWAWKGGVETRLN